MLPPVKTMIAVAVAVWAADYFGAKAANAVLGPEIDGSGTDATINSLKVTGIRSIIGVGTFIGVSAVMGGI